MMDPTHLLVLHIIEIVPHGQLLIAHAASQREEGGEACLNQDIAILFHQLFLFKGTSPPILGRVSEDQRLMAHELSLKLFHGDPRAPLNVAPGNLIVVSSFLGVLSSCSRSGTSISLFFLPSSPPLTLCPSMPPELLLRCRLSVVLSLFLGVVRSCERRSQR